MDVNVFLYFCLLSLPTLSGGVVVRWREWGGGRMRGGWGWGGQWGGVAEEGQRGEAWREGTQHQDKTHGHHLQKEEKFFTSLHDKKMFHVTLTSTGSWKIFLQGAFRSYHEARPCLGWGHFTRTGNDFPGNQRLKLLQLLQQWPGQGR